MTTAERIINEATNNEWVNVNAVRKTAKQEKIHFSKCIHTQGCRLASTGCDVQIIFTYTFNDNSVLDLYIYADKNNSSEYNAKYIAKEVAARYSREYTLENGGRDGFFHQCYYKQIEA